MGYVGSYGRSTFASAVPPKVSGVPSTPSVPGPLPGMTQAESKALRITSLFETGRPLNFAGLSGDFDGQGISFGLLQWNIGTGSLQPLLAEFATNQPQRFDAAFGPDAGRMRDTLRRPLPEQLQLVRALTDPTDPHKNRVIEPWATYFRRLGADPEFQQIQLRHVRPRVDAAARWARQFGLRSERALAFMFDIVTQHGAQWLNRRGSNRAALIEERRRALPQQVGGPLTERQLMTVIAHVIADTASPRWRDRVLARRMTIIDGRGRMVGRDVNLGREFGLTDEPWESAAGVAPPAPAPSQPAGPPRSPAGEARFVEDAIGRGVRGESSLTDLVFYARHPERRGRPLMRDEQALIHEWRDVRARVVQPALARAGGR